VLLAIILLLGFQSLLLTSVFYIVTVSLLLFQFLISFFFISNVPVLSSLCARLYWQPVCQFSSANSILYHIIA